MHIESIIFGGIALVNVAFGIDCLGVVDQVGTPVAINSCVSNINYDTNDTVSFTYKCNGNGTDAELIQLFYDDVSCSGTPLQSNDATQDVIDFNCNTQVQCDSFIVSITSGAECSINATNATNTTGNNGDEVIEMSIVADQCINITSLDLDSGAVSADFLCNSTHYQVQHYSGIKTRYLSIKGIFSQLHAFLYDN